MINENYSVDLILTDPPYNISKDNNFKTIGRAGIDFGKWDKNFDQLSWLDDITNIVSKNGSIIIFNDWKNMGMISAKLEKEGFEIKDLIRWIKPSPMPRNVNRRYVTDFEFAIWAVKKGAKWTFNKLSDKPYMIPEYTSTVPIGASRIHPTQKPEKLISEIIKVHSNPGDIIFDPFSGSGTISCCADQLDRYYIASEINKKYYDESILRIKKNYIRPAFNHLGNKSRIIQDLIANFPKNNVVNFVEPFAGSGIVSISYNCAKKYWLNDKDKNLSKILEYLLNTNPEIIIEEIEKIIKQYKLPISNIANYSKQYNALKKEYNKCKRIDMLFVLILYGFNQQIRYNSKGEFNIPAGKFYWNEYHKKKILDFILKRKNKDVRTECLDFEEFLNSIEKYLNKDNTFIYFDPPYLLSNATYNNLWKEEDEKRLINYLQKLTDKGFKWCLSNVLSSKGKTNKLLNEFINKNKKVKKIDIDNVSYSNSNYQRKERSKKDLEVLIKGNF